MCCSVGFQVSLTELEREGDSLLGRQTTNDYAVSLSKFFGQGAHASLSQPTNLGATFPTSLRPETCDL